MSVNRRVSSHTSIPYARWLNDSGPSLLKVSDLLLLFQYELQGDVYIPAPQLDPLSIRRLSHHLRPQTSLVAFGSSHGVPGGREQHEEGKKASDEARASESQDFGEFSPRGHPEGLLRERGEGQGRRRRRRQLLRRHHSHVERLQFELRGRVAQDSPAVSCVCMYIQP